MVPSNYWPPSTSQNPFILAGNRGTLQPDAI